jgi:hypothetical protein
VQVSISRRSLQSQVPAPPNSIYKCSPAKGKALSFVPYDKNYQEVEGAITHGLWKLEEMEAKEKTALAS